MTAAPLSRSEMPVSFLALFLSFGREHPLFFFFSYFFFFLLLLLLLTCVVGVYGSSLARTAARARLEVNNNLDL